MLFPRSKTLDKGQIAVLDQEVTRPSLTYNTIFYCLEIHHYLIKRDIHLLSSNMCKKEMY